VPGQYARPSNKLVAKLVKACDRAGWEISGGGSKYYVMKAPDKKTIIVVSSTPRNERQVRGIIDRVRKMGVEI